MMNERLKKARLDAGFKTASAAIDKLNWNSSTYRAHENGQNNFKVDHAKLYAEAYGVSPSWLMIGDEKNNQAKDSTKATSKKIHKHNCIEHIFAAATLLKDDDTNSELIEKIQNCLDSLKAKK